MLQWLIMAALTAAASIALLVPLYRNRAAGANAGAEAAIYRDQLRELDREVERGVIGTTEADAARTEIGRRLLRAADAAAPAREPVSDQRRTLAAGLALVLVPAAAVALYVAIGTPGAVDQPLAARLDVENAVGDIDAMVAMVEQHLAANPDDGQGWEVIAPVYATAGRPTEAARAWANAIRILGSNAEREVGLAMAMTDISGGIVTEEARQAFERGLAFDPTAVTPRFYLALGLGQEGRNEEAAAAWRALLADAPAEGAQWVPLAQAQLAMVDPTAPPPEIPAAQLQMIEGMVASLAEQLKAQPNDPEGWAMLIRSYKVLERDAEAMTALADAKAALAANPQQIAMLDTLARELGLAVN
jgi:cytochrome c-type biogenesis protein CcmH